MSGSICAISITSSRIVFVGLDLDTRTLFVDKFAYSRGTLVETLGSVRDGCDVRKWLLHPRHMHNTPFLQTLCGTCESTCESSVLSETKNCPCDFVKSSAWKPEIGVDLVYRCLKIKNAERLFHSENHEPASSSPSLLSSTLYAYMLSVVDLHDDMIIASLGSLLHHVLSQSCLESCKDGVVVINDVVALQNESCMRLDKDTIEALNIFPRELHPNVIHGRGRAKDGFGLFALLDRTKSEPGKERLKEWLLCPLRRLEDIINRQDGVQVMTRLVHHDFQSSLSQELGHVRGILNILQRIKTATASCDDWDKLLISLSASQRLLHIISCEANTADNIADKRWLSSLMQQIDIEGFSQLTYWLKNVLSVEGHHNNRTVTVARKQSVALDHARDRYENLERYLHDAGVTILNVSPFLENLMVEFVPHLGYLVSVDGEYSEWDDTEFSLIYSDDDGQQYLKHPVVVELDNTLGDLRTQMQIEAAAVLLCVEDQVLNQEVLLQTVSDSLATIDAVASLGKVSKERNYVRPNMAEEPIIAVQNGRHPLHELVVDDFISNDAYMNGRNKKSICLVTGPNSSGKSAYLGMVGSIVLLAHIGSGVPAKKALVGQTDKLLVRVSCVLPESCIEPSSAFTTDLNGVCKICRAVTDRSVCLVDDFGISTSPIDGMALLAALIDVLKISKSRTLLSLPFPEMMQGHSTLEENVTICSMLVHEGGSSPDCSNIPLYALKQGLSSVAEGIPCGLVAGIKSSIMRRAEQVKLNFSRYTRIPVAHDLLQLGGASFDQEERQYLRNFLIS